MTHYFTKEFFTASIACHTPAPLVGSGGLLGRTVPLARFGETMIRPTSHVAHTQSNRFFGLSSCMRYSILLAICFAPAKKHTRRARTSAWQSGSRENLSGPLLRENHRQRRKKAMDVGIPKKSFFSGHVFWNLRGRAISLCSAIRCSAWRDSLANRFTSSFTAYSKTAPSSLRRRLFVSNPVPHT